MTQPVVEKPGRTGRLLTNFSWLAGGRTTGALMTLAATALAARALGAAEFGLVVLIHAAALMIRQLCNVKTSEAIIRYGVPLAEEGRIGELRGFIIRMARIDLVAGIIAALAGAVVLGVLFLASGLELGFTRSMPAARRLLKASVLYLPLLCCRRPLPHRKSTILKS